MMPTGAAKPMLPVDTTASSPASLPFRPVLAPLIRHRATAAAIGMASAAQIAATLLHLPAMECPFLRVTGIPCPGCGLSRACAALVGGSHEHSLRMHAFALPVLVGVGILLLAAVLPERARLKMSRAFEQVENATGVTFLLLAGLLVYWLARLLYAPHAFISLVGQH